MCDFSLQSVRSRPAKVGDKLVTRDFGTGTRGFSAADDPGMAVCIMPGTELAFAGDVACLPAGLLGWKTKTINYQTAIFRQVNKDKLAALKKYCKKKKLKLYEVSAVTGKGIDALKYAMAEEVQKFREQELSEAVEKN